MNHYRIRVARAYLVTEETLLDVDARDEASAKKKALKIANSINECIEWDEVNSECAEKPRVIQTNNTGKA